MKAVGAVLIAPVSKWISPLTGISRGNCDFQTFGAISGQEADYASDFSRISLFKLTR